MPKRGERKSILQLLATFAWLPLLLVAFVLFNLVTWVPEAVPRRNALSGTFAAAALGTYIVSLDRVPRARWWSGATILVVSFAALVACFLWL